MTKTFLLRSSLIIGAFLLYRYSKYFFAYCCFGVKQWNAMNENISSSFLLAAGIVIALGCNYGISKRISFRELGLGNDFLKGLFWGFVFTLPQFIGLSFLSGFKYSFSPGSAYEAIVLAGFGEEFIFRGFLFGLLFYYAGWGFLPAGIFTGLFFGWGHLYQAESLGQAIGIFFFTTGASVGFAWFYHAWKSLWMVIFLHGFMDLAWTSTMNSELAPNVLGSVWVNVFRFSTLIFAIVFSIWYSKKIGTYDVKKRLWVNKLKRDL
ncbi:MAG: CPBP family intramembrane glutamic endopeptidase [Bacteroidota bacterium]